MLSERAKLAIAAVAVASGQPSRSVPAIAAASPATDAPAVTHGVEASIADVPWSKVGPGWTLATWSPVTPHMPGVQPPPGEPTWGTVSTTLYLVDPAGNRYAITTFAPAGIANRTWRCWTGRAMATTPCSARSIPHRRQRYWSTCTPAARPPSTSTAIPSSPVRRQGHPGVHRRWERPIGDVEAHRPQRHRADDISDRAARRRRTIHRQPPRVGRRHTARPRHRPQPGGHAQRRDDRPHPVRADSGRPMQGGEVVDRVGDTYSMHQRPAARHPSCGRCRWTARPRPH